ncbi:unnamed protein product [Ceratitis capitata]|uniref:(Mediterranean fruit fly) hypothetical protein n=1 Tax=Ceratitis capitata TaxID=7213 RepID=A0A811V2F9_CERCA|nr:unnamed protein product [Ceratitis capitata]
MKQEMQSYIISAVHKLLTATAQQQQRQQLPANYKTRTTSAAVTPPQNEYTVPKYTNSFDIFTRQAELPTTLDA